MRIFKCKKCGNIVLLVKEGTCIPNCCGEDAAVEKHVPVVSIDGNNIEVVCGEVPHPMEEKHFIEFIAIETTKGVQVKYLKPGETPKATFSLKEEDLISAYAYCNLHGLWKNK